MDSEELERRKLELVRQLRAAGHDSAYIEERLASIDSAHEHEQYEQSVGKAQSKLLTVPVILGPDGRPFR